MVFNKKISFDKMIDKWLNDTHSSQNNLPHKKHSNTEGYVGHFCIFAEFGHFDFLESDVGFCHFVLLLFSGGY